MIDIRQTGNKIIITCSDSGERFSLTKSDLEVKVADILGKAVSISEEKFETFQDEGEVEITLGTEETEEAEVEMEEETEEAETNRKSGNRRRTYRNYNGCRNKKMIWEVLQPFIDDDYIITEAIIRSGRSAEKFEARGIDDELELESYHFCGEKITLLEMIADDIGVRHSGMDCRLADDVKIKEEDDRIIITVITDNKGRDIIGRYVLKDNLTFSREIGLSWKIRSDID